jgi:hypothetical protein
MCKLRTLDGRIVFTDKTFLTTHFATFTKAFEFDKQDDDTMMTLDLPICKNGDVLHILFQICQMMDQQNFTTLDQFMHNNVAHRGSKLWLHLLEVALFLHTTQTITQYITRFIASFIRDKAPTEIRSTFDLADDLASNSPPQPLTWSPVFVGVEKTHVDTAFIEPTHE